MDINGTDIGNDMDSVIVASDFLPVSQGASQSFLQTSNVYQLLVLCKEFFAQGGC